MAVIPNYTVEAANARMANAAFFLAIDALQGAQGTLDTVYALRSTPTDDGLERGLGPLAGDASLRVAERLKVDPLDPASANHPLHYEGMVKAYNDERAKNGGMPLVEDVPATLGTVFGASTAFWAKLEAVLPALGDTLAESTFARRLVAEPFGDGSYRLNWVDPASSLIRDALQPELGALHAVLKTAVGAE